MKWVDRWIVIVLSVIFSCSNVFATDYYVRPAADGEYNLEDGSSYENAFDGFVDIDGTAWTAIDGEDNATIYVCGTFRETLTIGAGGESGHIITIKKHPSYDAIIIGSDLLATWSQYAATNIYSATWTPNTVGQVFQNSSRLLYVTWDTNIATTAATMSAGTWSIDTANDLIYVWATDDADPDTHTIEVGSRSNCIANTGTHGYITIDGIEMSKTNDSAPINVTAGAVYWTIQNCNIHDGYKYNLRLVGVAAGTGIENFTIQNNDVYNAGSTGIYIVDHGHDNTIQTNNVYRNCQMKVDSNADFDFTAGIRIIAASDATKMTNTIIQNNNVYENGTGMQHASGSATVSGIQRGGGIWIDTVGTGNVVRYNKVYSNHFVGIKLDECPYAPAVYYNLVYNHTNATPVGADAANQYGQGINLAGGSTNIIQDATVYNNVFYGNRYGIMGSGYWTGATYQANTCMDNIIKNNIFSASTVAALRMVGGCSNDGGFGSGNVYTYNIIYPEAAAFVEWVLGSTYDNAAAWDAVYADASLNVFSDPLFNSTTYFLPKYSSPAIDVGDGTLGLTADYTGGKVPRGAGVDIGAYEYVPNAIIDTMKSILAGIGINL